MSGWAPPKNGTACWVEIPATDVPRAKEFYAKVFDWTFKPAPAEGGYTEEKMAMFNFPDQKLETLSGGIVKFEKEELTQGKGGTKVYLWVDNIEAMVEKIREAGGKPIGEKYVEGTSGWIHDFQDTEGNYGGIYSLKNDK